MEMIFKMFEYLPRLGPGDRESTLKALSMIKDLPENPLILDIACGKGEQTIGLLENTNSKIIATDVYDPFLDCLSDKLKSKGLQNRVEIKNMSMTDLDFDKESFDLIWSEGAIDIMGFKNGLSKWKPILKKNGYIVVSNITWFKNREVVPKEVKAFLEGYVHKIFTTEDYIKIIEELGYKYIDSFKLPESSWWKFFNPFLEKKDELLKNFENNKAGIDIVKDFSEQINIYRKYSEYYGYVFYIMQK